MGHQVSVAQCCSEILHEDYISTCEDCGLSVCGWCVENSVGVKRDEHFSSMIYPFANEDGELKREHCYHCNKKE